MKLFFPNFIQSPFENRLVLSRLQIGRRIESFHGIIEVHIRISIMITKAPIILLLYCQFMKFILSYPLKF
jgi:hypothetical protein